MSHRRLLVLRILCTIGLLVVTGLVTGAILTDHQSASSKFGEAAIFAFCILPLFGATWMVEP